MQLYLEREDIFKGMSFEEIEYRLAQKGKKGHLPKVVLKQIED